MAAKELKATWHLNNMVDNISMAKEAMVKATAVKAAMVAKVAMVAKAAGKAVVAIAAVKVSREDMLCQDGADHSALILGTKALALVDDCHKLDHPLASEEEEVIDQEDPLDAGVDLVLESYLNLMFQAFSNDTVVRENSAMDLKKSNHSLPSKTLLNQYGECFHFVKQIIGVLKRYALSNRKFE